MTNKCVATVDDVPATRDATWIAGLRMSLAMLLSGWSIHAAAFWDPPYVTPSNPTATDDVAINVYMGDCDAIFAVPAYPQVTRDGDSIHVLEFGQHWDPGELCVFTRGTAAIPLRSFTPGRYTVKLDLAYIDFFGNPQVETLGVVPFAVSAAPQQAVSVELLGRPSSALLTTLVAALACLELRRRRLLSLMRLAS